MGAKASLIVFLYCIIAYSCAQLSLDDILKEVFKKPLLENKTQTFNWDASGSKSCGKDKQCVPRHLCVDGAISATGENVIDIRINDDVCSYSEICCDLPNKRTEPVIPAIPKEQHEGCGWRNADGVGFKIIGATNNEAQFGEFPWMVAIFHTKYYDGEIIYSNACGGSIIAPNVIITTAYCVNRFNANQLVVRAGEWDIGNTNEILSHVDRQVKEIIIHEKYNKTTAYNEVALLILEEPFIWKENIRPICLPEPNFNFDHSRCFAIGWGRYKFGREGKYQDILKKIDLPIVPQDTCQNYLRQTRLGSNFNLHESFLCAGGEKDKDTCNGDGGSPLVCPITGVKNRYYQAGIVAWGVGCGRENVPGVYSNIPYLHPWISEKLAARGISFAPFTP